MSLTLVGQCAGTSLRQREGIPGGTRALSCPHRVNYHAKPSMLSAVTSWLSIKGVVGIIVQSLQPIFSLDQKLVQQFAENHRHHR